MAGAAFGEEPLDTVIDRLADEDAVTREDAERALVARGAGVLESLERRRVNCSWNDAEGNARLANAIARIRDDIEWGEAERRARTHASGRMCVHCRESAEVDAVRLRDGFLRRFIRGARLVALRGACCAEAALSWQVLIAAENGPLAAADFAPEGLLMERLVPVESTGDACRLAAVLRAALTEPGNFEVAWPEVLRETRVELQDEKQTRVQCGEIGRGQSFTFDADGRLIRVYSLSW